MVLKGFYLNIKLESRDYKMNQWDLIFLVVAQVCEKEIKTQIAKNISYIAILR